MLRRGRALVVGLTLVTLAAEAVAQPPVEAPPTDGEAPGEDAEAQAPEEAGTGEEGEGSDEPAAVPEPPTDPADGSPAEVLPPPPPTGSLDPELLGLCASIDPAARRYCLRRIEESGEPTDAVRAALTELSSRDPELHTRAQAAFRRLFGMEPPPYQAFDEERPDAPPAEDAEPPIPPGDPYRVIYAPTAWVRPSGTVGFNAYELGTAQVDFGVDEHVQLGFQTMIPIGVVAIGGIARFGWEFDGGAIGVQGNALALVPFVDGGDDPIFLYGGGPMLTLGDAERYLNGGMMIYGGSTADADVVMVIPHLGGSLQLGARVKLNAELYAFSGSDGGPDLGELFALVWGVRIFGENIWGYIALIDPICEDCGEIYEVIPLGIPFLNVGANL